MSRSSPTMIATPTEGQAAAFLQMLTACKDTAARVALVRTGLSSPAGAALRTQAAIWITENLVPASRLVPKAYSDWRTPVQDAMRFVIEHLSTDRLAPKLVEQFELPPNKSAERRLLRLISRVPALQKLGQIISRNRHLSAPLRAALSRLENSIHDISANQAHGLVVSQLGTLLNVHGMKVSKSIVAEGSVSAIVRFTWVNPETSCRERGILKVLKPWVAQYLNEDLEILEQLSIFFSHHEQYQVGRGVIADTFRKVRRHLAHEIDFPGEQRALTEAAECYSSGGMVRVPRLIATFCTPTLTAMSEERGINVARVRGLKTKKRAAIAEQLVDAIVLTPLLSKRETALFHADPHPGNLLYDNDRNRLALIDWALSDHLSLEQRRMIIKLFVGITLRDPDGTYAAIKSLTERPSGFGRDAVRARRTIGVFIDTLPLTHVPDALDPMLLLEQIAQLGVRFPSALILFSKTLFTLSGVLDDLRRTEQVSILSILRKVATQTSLIRRTISSPLRVSDWASFPIPASLYFARCVLAAEEAIVNRVLLPANSD